MGFMQKLFITTLVLSLLFQSKCLSQIEGLYPTAYHYIIKSKELKNFRDEIRVTHGIIARRITVIDSVIPNNPYFFICAILQKKTKKEGNCSESIGTDRLKTFDSLRQEYNGYIYSRKFKLPFNFKGSKAKKAFILSFSDVYLNTLIAQLSFKNKRNQILSAKSQLFYFVFLPNGKIKAIYTADIQNYHRK
jgi:hypothetical protein